MGSRKRLKLVLKLLVVVSIKCVKQVYLYYILIGQKSLNGSVVLAGRRKNRRGTRCPAALGKVLLNVEGT